jgi:hypothetical protein
MPSAASAPPGYEQKNFAEAEKRGVLRLVASADGAHGSVKIRADAKLYAGLFDGTESASLELNVARKAYAHVVRGTLSINGHALQGGDALRISYLFMSYQARLRSRRAREFRHRKVCSWIAHSGRAHTASHGPRFDRCLRISRDCPSRAKDRCVVALP